jgi:predicted nucleotide-binding protein
VYYGDFEKVPIGRHFAGSLVGLSNPYNSDSLSESDWTEYNKELVVDYIFKRANILDFPLIQKKVESMVSIFEEIKSQLASLLSLATDQVGDKFLDDLFVDLKKVTIISTNDIIKKMRPNGTLLTQDILAVSQGLRTPPHIKILAEANQLSNTFYLISYCAGIAKKASSHMNLKNNKFNSVTKQGDKLFIGHGHSLIWRVLKDFIQDELKLPWDEFERVPVAGKTIVERLTEMLDSAKIAFLILTAEDETACGEVQARLNVIHEAGLFQGRLGFSRAIILLENGCKKFSNIDGLEYIPFHKGHIENAFEKIRGVLSREGII